MDCKKRKARFWLAIERHTYRIVAYVLGCWGVATLRRLWAAVPEQYRTGTWYFTNEWEAYTQVLPLEAHRLSHKDREHTSIVETSNSFIRQKYAVLVRKTHSFNCLVTMHHVRIQLAID